jgi:hypothetical protein
MGESGFVTAARRRVFQSLRVLAAEVGATIGIVDPHGDDHSRAPSVNDAGLDDLAFAVRTVEHQAACGCLAFDAVAGSGCRLASWRAAREPDAACSGRRVVARRHFQWAAIVVVVHHDDAGRRRRGTDYGDADAASDQHEDICPAESIRRDMDAREERLCRRLRLTRSP